jgi:hypothetical protein
VSNIRLSDVNRFEELVLPHVDAARDVAKADARGRRANVRRCTMNCNEATTLTAEYADGEIDGLRSHTHGCA